MGESATPSAPTPESRREGPTTSKRPHYLIRQHPHPAGSELTVEDATRKVLFITRPRLTEPSSYLIFPADEGQRKAFVVKLARIGQVERYVLFDGESERLSLLPRSPSPEVLVRDGKRHVIARFRPLGPGLVILRTRSTVHARLRSTQYAAPARLRVHCDMEEGSEWLLAVLLYVLLIAEQLAQKAPISESSRAPVAP